MTTLEPGREYMNNLTVFVTSYEEDIDGNIIVPKAMTINSKEEYFHLLSLVLFEAYGTVYKFGSKVSGMGILPMKILECKDDHDNWRVYEFEYFEDGRRL